MEQQKLIITVSYDARYVLFNPQKSLYGYGKDEGYNMEMVVDLCGVSRRFPINSVNIQSQSFVSGLNSTLYFGFKTTPSVTKLEII